MPRQSIESIFAECRSLGHEWRKGRPLGIDEEHDSMNRPGSIGSAIGIPSNCENCGTERVKWLSRSGEAITRYHYPDGYSRHGDDVLSAREWRESYVSNLFASFETSIKKANGGTKQRKASAA